MEEASSTWIDRQNLGSQSHKLFTIFDMIDHFGLVVGTVSFVVLPNSTPENVADVLRNVRAE